MLKEDKTTMYLPEPTGCVTSIPVNMYYLPTLRETSLHKTTYLFYELFDHLQRP